LAVPVLVVTTGFQQPDSTGLFGSTFALARRGNPHVVNLPRSRGPSRLTALEDIDED
jgi:hypothetical protein